MNRKTIGIGIALTIVLLVIHLLIMDSYGLTWDFHHHFFAGLELLGQPITPDLTANLPFTQPSPLITSKLPFGPLMSIAPVGTYLVLYKWFGIMALDNAYNIAIVLSGTAGILILYLFLLEAFGLSTAIAGFAFIAFLPRYFGDLHNNMKDVPQAAAFTLAIWMFWRLVRYQRVKDLLLASIAFAIAFNTKVNTLLVPIIAAVWWAVSNKKAHTVFSIIHNSRFIILYFLTAPLAALTLWSLFWRHPIEQLLYIPRFFIDNTQNIEVLINGAWYCSGVNVPWYYPLWYLTITTPLPILLFFLIGLMGLMSQMRYMKKNSTGLLLLLWFILPIVRYAFPRMGVIDGIRHFEEVVFPLSAIAAVGASRVFVSLSRSLLKRNVNTNTAVGINTFLFLLLSFLLIIPIIRYHPFQISYYNELVGGITGATGKYDIDYWGGPQKQAIRWLNATAPKDAVVHIVMAADVAGLYLRPDLRAKLNTTGYDAADFVVVLNRQGFFYRYEYLWEYILRAKAAYVVGTGGVPIVWVFENKRGQIPREKEWWQGQSPCIRRYW
ncbi:glycosyltransferase family 39 protein [Candidatus Gottesmanbacteria bacterium]|nr:glycosyltransferase family 39 protein [Candidatus Gottesmanbacteria bacterium]